MVSAGKIDYNFMKMHAWYIISCAINVGIAIDTYSSYMIHGTGLSFMIKLSVYLQGKINGL